jgi:hypothetical protein
MLRRRTLRLGVLWALLAVVAVSGFWALRIEVTYRRNISRLPALLDFHRHVITRVWRA